MSGVMLRDVGFAGVVGSANSPCWLATVQVRHHANVIAPVKVLPISSGLIVLPQRAQRLRICITIAPGVWRTTRDARQCPGR